MRCAWKELLGILPMWMRKEVDMLGSEAMQELRLRINSPPELLLSERRYWLNRKIVQEDLSYIMNAASQYSPWTASSAAHGYITASGGHRIGLCGDFPLHSCCTGFSRNCRSSDKINRVHSDTRATRLGKNNPSAGFD